MFGVTDEMAVNFADGATMPCSYFNLPTQYPSYRSVYARKDPDSVILGRSSVQELITKQDGLQCYLV